MKEKNTRVWDFSNPLDVAEVYMNPMEIQKDKEAKISKSAWNDEHRYLAYFLSSKGSDWNKGYIYD